MIKRDYESKQEINIETYLKKKKIKRENMEKTDIAICLKKKKRLKEYQKNYRELKNLNIIMNKIIFNFDLMMDPLI